MCEKLSQVKGTVDLEPQAGGDS